MRPNIQTTEPFQPLFLKDDAHYHDRYITYYGGRAGRKSWEIARSLIVKSYLKPKQLIVCTREIQNSIGDSVLRLLENQIDLLGCRNDFQVQRSTIIHDNGTEFIFKGLNGMTIDSLKSLEGADYCWVEEAHSVSEKSWSILIPTIRKPGSQIFVSFNPDLETDPAYQRFVLNSPPRSYCRKVSYLENPQCSQEAKDEADYLKRVDYDAYSHIWLGKVRHNTQAQIFQNKYKIQSFETEGLGDPIHGADWGFSVDPTVLIKSYIKGKTLYIRNEAYKINCEVDHTPDLFNQVPGARDYAIRADNSRPEMISFMKRAGFKIEAADKWPGCIVDRVSFLRNFEQIIIHPDCKHTAEEFRLYSYKTDKRTGDILPDIIDRHNHCIDALGYAITPLIRKKIVNFVL